MVVLVAIVAATLLVAWWRWRRDWHLSKEDFESYMAGAGWSRTKRRWFRSTLLPWRRWCRVCWSPHVQLHHRTYRRRGREWMHDLVPLCREHHLEVTLMHRVPGVSVEAATKRYLARPRVRILTAAPVLPVILAAAVVLPHLR